MMKVKLCKLYTLESCECRQGDEICFRYNKIGDTLILGVYKYASTFLMASRNKKRCNHRKKTWRKKIRKYAIVFASIVLSKIDENRCKQIVASLP